MNDIPQNDSHEVLANMKPLTKAEVKGKFPNCIVQESNPHSWSTTILDISDGTSKRLYYQISEDQYVPFTKDGEDVSDLISSVWANESVEFMGAHSVALDMDTWALKVIDNKLVWPTYTEPYVAVYNMDWDYLERMILINDKLSRAKLNWEEVILHDAWHGWTPNTIQFVWSENPTDFSWELVLDEDGNIVLNNNRILSRQEWLSQEWEIKGKNITLIWTKCISPEWVILPITLFWEDISSKVGTNEYGNESKLTLKGLSRTQRPVINNITWEVLTYKKSIICKADGHKARWDTDLWICRDLQGEDTGVILFNTKTFKTRPITLSWKDISEQLLFNWNSSWIINYRWKEYTLDFDTWVLYQFKTEVVNNSWDVSKITFLWWNLPKWAQMITGSLVQIDPEDSTSLVKFNSQTGEIEYKRDTSWKIYLEFMSKFRASSIEKVVFYNPQTQAMVKIYDRDLLNVIDALPYANTQQAIDESVKATEDTLSNADRT